jgi:hypothetical protein
MVRRLIGFILTVLLVGWSMYRLAWSPDLRELIMDHPYQSVGFVAAVLLTFVLWLWLVLDTNTPKAIGASVLSVVVALWGRELLGGISWGQIGLLFAALLVLVILGAITVLHEDDIERLRARIPGL